MAVGADDVIRHVSAITADTASVLGSLAVLNDCSRIAAAPEAGEHLLGAKKVNSAVDPAGLSDDEWDVLRQLAALRKIGQLRDVMARQGKELACQLHRDHGITGQRLAEAFGVSNATTSSWIREAKAIERAQASGLAAPSQNTKENHG